MKMKSLNESRNIVWIKVNKNWISLHIDRHIWDEHTIYFSFFLQMFFIISVAAFLYKYKNFSETNLKINSNSSWI